MEIQRSGTRRRMGVIRDRAPGVLEGLVRGVQNIQRAPSGGGGIFHGGHGDSLLLAGGETGKMERCRQKRCQEQISAASGDAVYSETPGRQGFGSGGMQPPPHASTGF